MYPFVVIWTSNDLILNEYSNYYGYVNNLDDIISKFNNLIIDIIKLYEHRIKNSIFYGDLNWNKFCSIVNNQSYDDSVFFDIKYFNIQDLKWYHFEIDDIDLEKNFIKSIRELFNTKITFSSNIIDKLDTFNNKKNKKILNQKNIKQILTIDL